MKKNEIKKEMAEILPQAKAFEQKKKTITEDEKKEYRALRARFMIMLDELNVNQVFDLYMDATYDREYPSGLYKILRRVKNEKQENWEDRHMRQ